MLFQFALVETVTTAFMDQFPSLRKHKTILMISTGIVGFLLGLIMCTEVSMNMHIALFADYKTRV